MFQKYYSGKRLTFYGLYPTRLIAYQKAKRFKLLNKKSRYFIKPARKGWELWVKK